MDLKFTISPIIAEDTQEIEKFLKSFFYQDSPLNKALNVTPNEGSELEFWSKYCIPDGKSFKAVLSNGEIIGVILNSFLFKDEPPMTQTTKINEKMQTIYNFIEYIEKQVSLFDIYSSIDKALYIEMLSVNKNYRNMGIAKELLKQTFNYMRENNLMVCQILCTNYYMIQLCEKLKFNSLIEIPFENYIVNGVQQFSPENPHRIAKILAKNL